MPDADFIMCSSWYFYNRGGNFFFQFFQKKEQKVWLRREERQRKIEKRKYGKERDSINRVEGKRERER